MYLDLMAERTQYLKKNQEGVKKMSKIMEKFSKDRTINAVIRTYREFSLDDAAIIQRIMERFQLTDEEARGYVKEKWSA